MRFGVLSRMCVLPSLRSAALCLTPLVLSPQCGVPLGGCTEEGQPSWLHAGHSGGRSGVDGECYSLCLQYLPPPFGLLAPDPIWVLFSLPWTPDSLLLFRA